MDNNNQNPPGGSYVSWFRDAAPYINANRGKTLVLMLGGEAVASANFSAIIHDIALLNSLGIRLVIVHGARPQVDAEFSQEGLLNNRHNGRLVINLDALQAIKEAVGAVRSDIEAALSMGLPNSPMHGAKLRIAGGNFVTAKPLGIQDGVDFGHSGAVRRIDTDGIRTQLDQGSIVLLSPLGYSPAGEIFHLPARILAAEAAIELGADKLVLMGNQPGLLDEQGELIREINTSDAHQQLQHGISDNETADYLKTACTVCASGVPRTHLVSYQDDGALLNELYTRDGAGTLVTVESYEQIRQARITDVGGIIELIRPLEKQGVLVRRSRELLEQEIDHFMVVERDNAVIGCAALYPLANTTMGELACVTIHPDYRHAERGDALLDAIIKAAKAEQLTQLLVLTTQTAHWFQERGFEAMDIAQLPQQKKALYNFQRNSRAFLRAI